MKCCSRSRFQSFYDDHARGNWTDLPLGKRPIPSDQKEYAAGLPLACVPYIDCQIQYGRGVLDIVEYGVMSACKDLSTVKRKKKHFHPRFLTSEMFICAVIICMIIFQVRCIQRFPGKPQSVNINYNSRERFSAGLSNRSGTPVYHRDQFRRPHDEKRPRIRYNSTS